MIFTGTKDDKSLCLGINAVSEIVSRKGHRYVPDQYQFTPTLNDEVALDKLIKYLKVAVFGQGTAPWVHLTQIITPAASALS
jgi:hypothetical protein